MAGLTNDEKKRKIAILAEISRSLWLLKENYGYKVAMKKCYICGKEAVLVCEDCGKPTCDAHFSWSHFSCDKCTDKFERNLPERHGGGVDIGQSGR